MPQSAASSDAETARILEAQHEALAALSAEREALAALQSSLRHFAEQDLQLHRSNTALLAAMRKELDTMQRRLKRLATAGA